MFNKESLEIIFWAIGLPILSITGIIVFPCQLSIRRKIAVWILLSIWTSGVVWWGMDNDTTLSRLWEGIVKWWNHGGYHALLLLAGMALLFYSIIITVILLILIDKKRGKTESGEQ